MSNKLQSMHVFVVAATSESFAAAARALDMSSVMVGKHVQALEQQLGASLIARTTRKQTLTEIGVNYLERCRDVLASVAAADAVAENLRATPQGNLRISAPVAYGTHRLMPVISEYAANYPQVNIDLELNNRVVNMADEAVDVAIRSGSLSDTDLIARPLRASRMLAAASPSYLARHAAPVHPSDLAQHNCLSLAAWGSKPVWRFSKAGETVPVPVEAAFASNYGQALLAAAVSGMGVVVQTDALLEASIAAGHLVLLLPDWELPSRALHVVRRAEIRPSAKVRSFIDLVVARLA
ncbi:LysR substrate-binding domain-containing protein [Undibacterium sp.]|uniref:LysR substrate-binding domain-containing protein n=1 Tax=Undibacterium sp. TaxID=1914977 RepID=UPI0025F41F0C|nr:LysR substrate-binding domain-containing protein [Undibacterium sp.]